MLRTLLAGLDGTRASRGVLEPGIRWARRHDALLVGAVMIDEPGIHGPQEWVLGETRFMRRVNQRFLHDATCGTEQLLESVALRCAEEQVAFKPLEDVGDPYDRIFAEAHRYDLILLGRETHFQFGFGKIPDDTLGRLLRGSPRPVVVVPETLGTGESALIAFDGSLQASRALQSFEATGLGRSSDLHVVSVAPNHRVAADHADRAIDFLAHHGVRAEPDPIASTDAPAAVLLDRARELGAGLIVMRVHGRSVLHEFFIGSTTQTMLEELPTSLFVSH